MMTAAYTNITFHPENINISSENLNNSKIRVCAINIFYIISISSAFF